MFSRDEKIYYRVRALEERLQVARSRNPAARSVHARLAEHYADRLRGLSAGDEGQ